MYTLMLINSSPNQIKGSIEQYLSKLNIVLANSAETAKQEFKIGTVNEEWTIVDCAFSAIPSFIMHLSNTLNAKVITSSYESSNGAYHYSEFENGKLHKVYTYCDALIEKDNVILKEIYEIAISKKQFNIPVGIEITEESLEYGSENYFEAASELDFQDSYKKVTEWIPIYLQSALPTESGYWNHSLKSTWNDLI